MNKVYDIAIVGAGISGVTAALRTSELGISTLLLEKQDAMVKGPPFCHLHAGGNLYPDISEEQCIKLLHQSIDMAKLFPESIDQRPTFISIPKTEDYKTEDILSRLDNIVTEYKELIEKDESNKVLGEPEDYYKLYEKADLEKLKKIESKKYPNSPDEWMVEVTKNVDYDKLKFPVILVSEYGWNLFRLAAQAYIALTKLKDCHLQLNTEVKEIIDCSNENAEHNWKIKTNKGEFYAQYILNAAGYQTGNIDNQLGIEEKRMVEFKAAYVSEWKSFKGRLPEMIFHGKRGTPHVMAQLTPYHNNYFQIHGMTEDITLFEDGLVKSKKENAQPDLDDSFDVKLEKGWSESDIDKRTKRAINFVAHFVPKFKEATLGGPPLFGAQQIPGEDASLRVAEVSFPKKFYGRSEIVKASSALDVADQVILKLKELNIIDSKFNINRKFNILKSISVDEINEAAPQFAKERGYPADMGLLYMKSIQQ